MAKNIFVHKGGPDKTAFFGDSLAAEIPLKCERLFGASHNTRQSYSDRFTFHKVLEEKVYDFIASKGDWAIDDVIYTHAVPAGFWLQFATVHGICPTVGLKFRVEMVGLLEGVDSNDPADHIDESDITVLIAEADAGFDPSDCEAQWLGEYASAAAGDHIKSNKMIRLVILEVPNESLFGACAKPSLGFEVSISYTDPCFIESFAGSCNDMLCGDPTTAV